MTDDPGERAADLPTPPPAPAPVTTTPGPVTVVQAEPSPGPLTPAPGEERVMSLVGHLTELRDRVVKSILAIGIGAVLGFFASELVVGLLYDALPPGSPPLQVFSPGDAFAIRLRISLIIGIVLAMPILLWQLWSFIKPGLTARERRAVGPWVPLSLAFFSLGVIIAWVVLPFAVTFLTGFLTTDMAFLPSAREYFDFASTLFLAFGLVLQFPILLYGLSRVGIVTSRLLAGNRRIALLVIAIFAAAATPGGDLVSPGILGVTMYALYEGTVFAIRRSGK